MYIGVPYQKDFLLVLRLQKEEIQHIYNSNFNSIIVRKESLLTEQPYLYWMTNSDGDN